MRLTDPRQSAERPPCGRCADPVCPAHRIHRQTRGQELRAAVTALAARLTAALADQP